MTPDERVIVVIGGDDNYRNASEEDGSLLSCWARRKVFFLSSKKNSWMESRGLFFLGTRNTGGFMRRHCYIFLIPRRRVKNFFTKINLRQSPCRVKL